MAEQWMSIVEYARAYKVSDMTIRRRIKTGKLQAVLQDGKYYIPVASPVQRHGAQPPSPPPAPPAAAYHAPPHAARSDARGPRGALDGAYSREAMAQEASRHPGSGMTVIKGHPQAMQTVSRAYAEQAPQIPFTTPLSESGGDLDHSDVSIPASLKRPFAGQETSLIDTRALLAFCEASMRKMAEVERRQVERFKAKLETLEATVAARDQEVKLLKQQLEDMQLLVRILERKK